jgi:hypothetical protein
MTDVFDINTEENDERYKMLKERFKEQIKARFTCEDYDPIIK